MLVMLMLVAVEALIVDFVLLLLTGVALLRELFVALVMLLVMVLVILLVILLVMLLVIILEIPLMMLHC